MQYLRRRIHFAVSKILNETKSRTIRRFFSKRSEGDYTMLDRLYIKSLAKAQISGNIGMLLVCGLLMGLIISVASVLAWVVAPAFGISTLLIFLRLTVGEAPEVSKIFDGFNVFGQALWLNIQIGVFTCLWSLLFFFPGIIKSYSYRLAPYILADHPELTASEALRESMHMTNGAKMDLFVLDLSFLGWFCLVMVTGGLAGIYVLPYYQAAQTNAYLALKAKQYGAAEF